MLKHRHRQPELMDDPALDPAVHAAALQGLRRVNRLSGTAAVLERAILQNCAGLHTGRPAATAGQPLRILDIASGAGDLVIQLAQRLQRRGLAVEVSGCDISPVAVDFANQQAQQSGCSQVNFFTHDALQDSLPPGSYDVVMSSLFMHHLDEPQAIRLLQFIRQTAAQLMLVDDLRRTAVGYGLAWLGCRLLTRCRVVHIDGPLSVQGAFTVSEADQLAQQAGWKDYRITTHWPQRFLMISRVSS